MSAGSPFDLEEELVYLDCILLLSRTLGDLEPELFFYAEPGEAKFP